MKFYRCNNFQLYELLSPEIYFNFVEKGWIDPNTGDGFAWALFDERALKTLDKLSDVFETAIVNNWWWYYVKLNASEKLKARKNSFWIKKQKQDKRIRLFSGYRSKLCPIGAEFSGHRYFRAFDVIFPDISAYKVRNYIFKNPEEFPFLTTLETEIPWLHFSTRNHIYSNHTERFWLIPKN